MRHSSLLGPRGLAVALTVLLTACGREPAQPPPAPSPAPSVAEVASQRAPASRPPAPAASPPAPAHGPAPTEPVTVAPPPARRPAPTVGAVLGQRRDGELLDVLRRSDAPAPTRYAALRRLEELGSREAVPAAVALLKGDDRFLRSNALALLSRSKDPRAAQALAALPPRERLLVQALRRREGGAQ